MTKGMESVCVVESVAKVVVIEVPANLATGHFRSDAEQVFLSIPLLVDYSHGYL